VDIAVMQKVGWAITVANCAIGMQAHAHSQTEKNGGEGAVREVCDAILIAKNLLMVS
jgi:3-deoxy-D-manno-octulosonate 8-phosphate phosphatase (KDO 8-P phosphatase)